MKGVKQRFVKILTLEGVFSDAPVLLTLLCAFGACRPKDQTVPKKLPFKWNN